MSCWLVTWFLKWCPDFLMSGRTSLHCHVLEVVPLHYWRLAHQEKNSLSSFGTGFSLVQSPSHIWSVLYCTDSFKKICLFFSSVLVSSMGKGWFSSRHSCGYLGFTPGSSRYTVHDWCDVTPYLLCSSFLCHPLSQCLHRTPAKEALVHPVFWTRRRQMQFFQVRNGRSNVC